MSDKPEKPFFDSSTLIYTLSKSDPRAAVAMQLVANGGVISAQVLNEFAAVARRKLKMSWEQVSAALQEIRSSCDAVMPLTVETHEAALRIAARYGYHIYDALILASAIEAGCDIVYSEDMQDGQRIEGVAICNPFR